MSKKKLLIIGSTPHPNIGFTYGGTTVLMQSFLDFCEEHELNYEFIQANKYIGQLASIRNLLFVVYYLFAKIRACDVVMLNSASRGAFYVAPIIICMTKCFKKKFVFRMFGGNFSKILNSASSLKQKVFIKTVLRADRLFFETKESVDYVMKFSNSQDKLFWLPNVRKRAVVKRESVEFNRKFVFVSHIKRTKGVLEILDAAKLLPDNYTIDLYGPLVDDAITMDTFNGAKANYRGVLTPQEVIPTLANYDVLLLPSYHPGEGYPGIIIEALSLGIPVIATNWNAIPEIITDGQEGFLITPKSSEELVAAICSINNCNYRDLKRNASERFCEFEESSVYKNLIEKMLI